MQTRHQVTFLTELPALSTVSVWSGLRKTLLCERYTAFISIPHNTGTMILRNLSLGLCRVTRIISVEEILMFP
jgi:hypothetical protein